LPVAVAEVVTAGVCGLLAADEVPLKVLVPTFAGDDADEKLEVDALEVDEPGVWDDWFDPPLEAGLALAGVPGEDFVAGVLAVAVVVWPAVALPDCAPGEPLVAGADVEVVDAEPAEGSGAALG
jgi:hypothetical protein